MNRVRPRRSMLYMPGNNPNMLQNCCCLGADGLLLDLEDAVSPECKDEARRLVVYFMRKLDFGDTEVTVRINGTDTPWWRDDLKEIIPARPHAVRLPKCNDPSDIRELDSVISKIEAEEGIPVGSIEIHAMIETAEAVERASEIARACERVSAITLGGQDLAADIGVRRSKEGVEILYARSRVVIAAKAAGIACFDTVFTDINDSEGLYKEASLAAQLGFTGKAAIHPSQVRVINEAFRPTEKAIQQAEKIIAAAKEAKIKGIGAYAVDGNMVDGPVVKQALNVLAQAGISCDPAEVL
jgi:citrate lyase subunit beta/citryl-CoA lyase